MVSSERSLRRRPATWWCSTRALGLLLVLAAVVPAARGQRGQQRKGKNVKTPEMRAAFEKMHDMYCKEHDHMDSPVCSIYYGKRNGDASGGRAPLPPNPPSREEIFDMHRLFCESSPENADAYPCQKWFAKQKMRSEKKAGTPAS